MSLTAHRDLTFNRKNRPWRNTAGFNLNPKGFMLWAVVRFRLMAGVLFEGVCFVSVPLSGVLGAKGRSLQRLWDAYCLQMHLE